MKLGIISDTHNEVGNLANALSILEKEKVALLIHCGDWTLPDFLDNFKDCSFPVKGVLGNCDTLLSVYEHKIDFGLSTPKEKIKIESDLLEFNFFGKMTAVIHGHQPGYLEELIKSQLYDLILTGHTHRPAISRSDRSLVINPGPICGSVGLPRVPAPATFAIYDSEKQIAEIKTIK